MYITAWRYLQGVGDRNAVNRCHIVKIIVAQPSAMLSSMNRVCFEEDILTKISKLEN